VFRLITAGLGLALFLATSNARATSSSDPAILKPGSVRTSVAGGLVVLDRDYTWDVDISFEVGLYKRVELVGPLALGICLVDIEPGSAVYFGGGVFDMRITPDGRLLYTPALALAGLARLGPEAALRLALDLTWLEEDFDGSDHPLWMRGAFGLVIDFGPWATVAAGASYQRILANGEVPDGAESTGWVGDSRFSAGAVRSQPFTDLPTISVHITDYLDVILLVRVDVDTDTETTDTRWLLGLGLDL
jgi:hypothetical protein